MAVTESGPWAAPSLDTISEDLDTSTVLAKLPQSTPHPKRGNRDKDINPHLLNQLGISIQVDCDPGVLDDEENDSEFKLPGDDYLGPAKKEEEEDINCIMKMKMTTIPCRLDPLPQSQRVVDVPGKLKGFQKWRAQLCLRENRLNAQSARATKTLRMLQSLVSP